MYGENTKTIAIPIYRVLPYPVILLRSSCAIVAGGGEPGDEAKKLVVVVLSVFMNCITMIHVHVACSSMHVHVQVLSTPANKNTYM